MQCRFRRDNALASEKERSHERTVKVGAVTIGGRIDGIEHSYLQDRAFRKCVQCGSDRWIETGLQVKLQNGARGHSNRRNGWSLRISGSGKQTGETQN